MLKVNRNRTTNKELPTKSSKTWISEVSVFAIDQLRLGKDDAEPAPFKNNKSYLTSPLTSFLATYKTRTNLVRIFFFYFRLKALQSYNNSLSMAYVNVIRNLRAQFADSDP